METEEQKNSKMQVPYFQVPNDIFELEITATEKLILMYLIRCGNQGSNIFPSYKTIAEKCSLGRRTAINTIQHLEDKGLIKVQQRPKSNNDNYPNLYYLPGAFNALGASATDAPPSAADAPYKELPEKELHHYKEIITGSIPEEYPSITLSFKEFKDKYEITEDVEFVIGCFLREYKETVGKDHMKLRPETWQQVAETILHVEEEYGRFDELEMENFEEVINHYFEKAAAGKYNVDNFCITHFNHPEIKKINCYEVALY